MATVPLGFNIDAPRWDQSTFMGRLKHFLNITDPRTVLVREEELDRAKALVEGCRAGLVPPGSSQEQLLYAKKLYDSAFHPDSGEKMNLIGRMSFQVPGGMALTGCMLQFYRTVPAVVFWQWVNQSFNAIVNYTNRNAASPISLRQIGVAYVTATGTALATAVGLNLYTKQAPPLLARWVPFAAVAAANCVNIPMMRQQEIINGIMVTDGDNNELGCSRRAAVKGIAQVVVSRITMAAPGMIILPIIMERLEKFPFMQRIRVLHGPLQVLLCGGFLLFMVPAACALFPQRCSLALADLELELRDSIVAKHGDKVPYVYFNKGLQGWYVDLVPELKGKDVASVADQTPVTGEMTLDDFPHPRVLFVFLPRQCLHDANLGLLRGLSHPEEEQLEFAADFFQRRKEPQNLA